METKKKGMERRDGHKTKGRVEYGVLGDGLGLYYNRIISNLTRQLLSSDLSMSATVSKFTKSFSTFRFSSDEGSHLTIPASHRSDLTIGQSVTKKFFRTHLSTIQINAKSA
ncbi:hypothetical protein CDAR_223291 [Caerostris darwini]|uniref:Uncharacterized protein n=1 Tax=Caerostris darwini TaxID=1538125 RepID=A0AAV4W7S3_9ARAC|nr:hypothetical protein CDAR_223291 [Caerostris darwini]